MASSARIDELKQKFDENPRRYFAPLANEFRKVGDLEQAILICEAYLPQQPGHMSGHIVYGQALFESGRLDESQGVFQTALSLDPENLIALRHLGDIAARQGDPTSARRWYERVLEADPRNEEIQGLIGGLEAQGAGPERPAAHGGEFTSVAGEPATPVAEFAAAPDAHFATPTVLPADVPELLDLDVTLPESSPAASDDAEPSQAMMEAPGGANFEPTSFGEFNKAPETSDLVPDVTGQAVGFESTEFTAPSSEIPQTPGLQSAFEDETGIYGAAVTPLAGFEATAEETRQESAPTDHAAFPELDEPLETDEELVLPPHGDSIAASTPPAPAAPPAAVSQDDSLLDFDMPVVAEAAANAETASAPTIPAELPPEVIAAEAELTDTANSVEPAADSTSAPEESEPESVGSELSYIEVDERASAEAPTTESMAEAEAEVETEIDAEPVSAAQRPFVTETMAELYLKQGFRAEALSVYEQLSAASPADHRLADKVASLRAESVPAAAVGPPVREFFARFAARRPWERAAAAAPPSEDDFGASEPDAPGDADTTLGATTQASPGPRDTQAEAAPTPAGGSIDALFGNRPTGATEDSAASALSQAFGGSAPDAPPISGNPARQATGELSLDSVFRDGGNRGARNAQGFSFDQFFSQTADGERTSGGAAASPENPASGEPAERTADDIEQFNSWLQGLKQR
jgi:tetratricopeptide (TPR) repeat protein